MTIKTVSTSQNKILVDIGSSTVKIYLSSKRSLKPLVQKSIYFKKDFNPEAGISQEAKDELFGLIGFIQKKYPKTKVKIYATSIFRRLNDEAKAKLVDEFFIKTKLFFNIINQDLENFYLEMALAGKYSLRKPVLLINIGGGSTELVVVRQKQTLERKNIDLGVGTINSQFSKINEPVSEEKIQKIIKFTNKLLPGLENKVDTAFYSGGELTYMKRAGYELKPNKLFKDKEHPFIISFSDFKMRNREVFEVVTLDELEKFMPENPLWVHGARGCSAIAQSICEKYGIKTIIPSDSNIVHGIRRQEFRFITISGSFRKHLRQILKLKQQLEGQGVKILSPRFTRPKNPREEFVVFNGEEDLTPLNLERYHLNSIVNSDALVVCDPKGYVGASALIEIGFASVLGKRIIFSERPEEFMLNTLPAEIGL